MGNYFNKEPPPPLVLVPPLFDFPPLAARTRMLESSYNLLFGKLALKCLFEDYFEEARHFSTRIMLKPTDDPNVDLVATVSGPLDNKPEGKVLGNALFRWQGDVDDPHTFVDLFVSNYEPVLRLRSCSYYPTYGFGSFVIFPLQLKRRISSESYGVVGLRHSSENLSLGATFVPFSMADKCPTNAWLVSKIGRLTVGVQYEPQCGSKDYTRFKNLRNWSCAIGYGVGTGSPLSPSFIFGLELAKSSQFIASFYQHVVVQRRGRLGKKRGAGALRARRKGESFPALFSIVIGKDEWVVKNPLEENEVVGITNYIDFGFELQSRVEDVETSNGLPDSTFQVAASWQANKNFLLKGKAGPLSSSIVLAFKSWWKPSFTFSISGHPNYWNYLHYMMNWQYVTLKNRTTLGWLPTLKGRWARLLSLGSTRDRTVGKTALGFGIHVENIREASYERADPNFVMLTPSKEHLAEGIHWRSGKRPMLQSDINSENFDGLPRELRPYGNIL
ncbi:hypothetical protein CK203_067288 [Vitis vinifera]|uniref:Uncharacterized protein n=1 Tax=Vitis vinifera TaxID=29760 RepID=A0A438EFT9_VITVI|nr:hypothetical protein CK203_067288 [Vitis vinifera]